MAKDKPQASAERLLAIGSVVVASGDERITLAGELTEEQRQKLGEAKIRSLRSAGHLRTEQEAAEDERRAAALREGTARSADAINPNYGTPSMTPEAVAKSGADPGSPLAQAVAGSGAGSDTPSSGGPTDGDDAPVSDLDIAPATAAALEKAGLRTVRQVLEFGAEHDGLAGHVDGIGEAREEEIQAAIDKRK